MIPIFMESFNMIQKIFSYMIPNDIFLYVKYLMYICTLYDAYIKSMR